MMRVIAARRVLATETPLNLRDSRDSRAALATRQDEQNRL